MAMAATWLALGASKNASDATRLLLDRLERMDGDEDDEAAEEGAGNG
jgi:hypothetical protein